MCKKKSERNCRRITRFVPVEPGREKGSAKANAREAALCAKILGILSRARSGRSYKPAEMGVIVPFRSQISLVRKCLSEVFAEDEAADVLIDTVERFQGDEREVIVFSTVIRYAHQAGMISAMRADEDAPGAEEHVDRKLNVAVTRARERFYLVGDEDVLRRLHAYGKLLDWIDSKAGIFDGNE